MRRLLLAGQFKLPMWLPPGFSIKAAGESMPSPGNLAPGRCPPAKMTDTTILTPQTCQITLDFLT